MHQNNDWFMFQEKLKRKMPSLFSKGFKVKVRYAWKRQIISLRFLPSLNWIANAKSFWRKQQSNDLSKQVIYAEQPWLRMSFYCKDCKVMSFTGKFFSQYPQKGTRPYFCIICNLCLFTLKLDIEWAKMKPFL